MLDYNKLATTSIKHQTAYWDVSDWAVLVIVHVQSVGWVFRWNKNFKKQYLHLFLCFYLHYLHFSVTYIY